MDPLEALGLAPQTRAALALVAEDGLVPRRVASLSGERATLLDGEGSSPGVIPPRLLDPRSPLEERVTVGDWVAVRQPADPASSEAQVRALLPRTSVLARKAPGRAAAAQLLAANVDVLFVVTAFGDDLAIRRLERYLVVARTGGVDPVVVLNKADRVLDGAATAASIADRLRVPVVTTRALDAGGVDALRPWLDRAKTVAFVGSSGVGKSTLVNACLRDDARATGGVRSRDDKGRHTTTSRDLVVAPAGFLLVDTPGLREVAPWAGADDVASAFDDVEAIAARCRFRDCRHDGEPGCAVQGAVARGELEADRVGSRDRLVREAEALTRRTDAAAGRAAKQQLRARERGLRQRLRDKGR
jgi:ribosome biogenesis GTPase